MEQSLKELPNDFEEICTSINSRLDRYQSVISEKSVAETNPFQRQFLKTRISESIGNTEESASQMLIECESVSNWMNILHIEHDTFKQAESEDEESKVCDNSLLLVHRGNTSELKSLETEVQSVLRNLIDKKETNLSIRLSKILETSKKNLSERQDMLKRIVKSVDKQNTINKNATQENEELNDELVKYIKTLERYQSSESYEMLQKAKKIRYMKEAWGVNKGKMIDKITNLQNEINEYSTVDTATLSLAKQNMKNVDELAKLNNNYEDMLRSLREEMTIEVSRNQQMLQQINKELGGYRSTILSKEKKKTATELGKTKSLNDRLMNKLKKQTGTMKKHVEKSLKTQDKEGPSIEQCSEALESSHEKDMEFWGNILNDQKKEIQGILDDHVKDLKDEMDRQVEKVKFDNENKYAILQSKKERLIIAMNSRDIELSSVSERYAATSAMIEDYKQEVLNKESETEDLKNGISTRRGAEQSGEKELRNASAELTKFIKNAGTIRDYCLSKIQEKMIKIEKFPRVVQKKRPSSMMETLRFIQMEEENARKREEEEEFLRQQREKDLLKIDAEDPSLVQMTADGKFINSKGLPCNIYGQRINELGQLLNKRGEAVDENAHLINEFNQLINSKGHLVNEKDQLIDAAGNLVDENDRLINEEGHLINERGQLVNEEGQAIDEEGHLINEFDQLINENGHAVNEKGQLINQKGQLVNEDEHLINENGQLINKEGQLVNKDEHLINEKGQLINEEGQLVDKDEHLINEDGHLINKEGKLINKGGHLVNENGQLINKDGQLVNEDEKLVNEEGQRINEKGQIINNKGNLINENGQEINEIGQLVNEEGQAINEEGQLIDENNNVIEEEFTEENQENSNGKGRRNRPNRARKSRRSNKSKKSGGQDAKDDQEANKEETPVEEEEDEYYYYYDDDDDEEEEVATNENRKSVKSGRKSARDGSGSKRESRRSVRSSRRSERSGKKSGTEPSSGNRNSVRSSRRSARGNAGDDVNAEEEEEETFSSVNNNKGGNEEPLIKRRNSVRSNKESDNTNRVSVNSGINSAKSDRKSAISDKATTTNKVVSGGNKVVITEKSVNENNRNVVGNNKTLVGNNKTAANGIKNAVVNEGRKPVRSNISPVRENVTTPRDNKRPVRVSINGTVQQGSSKVDEDSKEEEDIKTVVRRRSSRRSKTSNREPSVRFEIENESSNENLTEEMKQKQMNPLVVTEDKRNDIRESLKIRRIRTRVRRIVKVTKSSPNNDGTMITEEEEEYYYEYSSDDDWDSNKNKSLIINHIPTDSARKSSRKESVKEEEEEKKEEEEEIIEEEEEEESEADAPPEKVHSVEEIVPPKELTPRAEIELRQQIKKAKRGSNGIYQFNAEFPLDVFHSSVGGGRIEPLNFNSLRKNETKPKGSLLIPMEKKEGKDGKERLTISYQKLVKSANAVTSFRPMSSERHRVQQKSMRIPYVLPQQNDLRSSLGYPILKSARYLWVRDGSNYRVAEVMPLDVLASFSVYNFQDKVISGKAKKRFFYEKTFEIPEKPKKRIPPLVFNTNNRTLPVFMPSPVMPSTVRRFPTKAFRRPVYGKSYTSRKEIEPPRLLSKGPSLLIRPITKSRIEKELSGKRKYIL